MNRSFLVIIIPAILVAIGYVLVLHWSGYGVPPLPFIGTGIAFVVALLLVNRHQRRKASRRSR
jgi:hypothetical protein